LMDEIGIVVQYILYFWCISFFNFFNLFWRKVTMMNLTKIWKVKFGSTSPLMGQVEAKPRVNSAKNLSTARVNMIISYYVNTTNMIRHLRNVHKKEPGCASGKSISNYYCYISFILIFFS
jgi:hypothetical protein